MKKKNKSKKNPFAKKWLKEFAEKFQKYISRSRKTKKLSSCRLGEIVCTQKDIGQPNSDWKWKKQCSSSKLLFEELVVKRIYILS